MSISICIVEDLHEVREGLKQIISLHSEFSLLESFSNAEEALIEIPKLRPEIVIMDINLPGMNGIECIRRTKALSPDTQFMMFTVYENDEKVLDALKAGASGYLLKNTGWMQMIEAIRELHEGGSPMSSTIARKLVTHFHENSNDSPQVHSLSPRENEVLLWLSKGLLYKEIAERLTIATGTVRQHIHNIYEKLHVQNRTEALNKAYGKK